VIANDPSPGGRPAYRPYRWATVDFQLGLQPIKPAQWMLLEPDYAAIMREKRARMADFPEQMITAASNAYSSSGRLVASVGKNVAWAHEPVPQLTSKLGPRIDRMISSIHTDTPCERFNWQLTPLSTKFFPHDAHDANADAMRQICDALRRNPERAEELLWIRVERQTLSRLPETRAVAFTLHTYSDPLASLRGDAESLRAILALMRTYSDARLEYSEMNYIRHSVIAWLESAVNKPA
jgi:hypothetical protein